MGGVGEGGGGGGDVFARAIGHAVFAQAIAGIAYISCSVRDSLSAVNE